MQNTHPQAKYTPQRIILNGGAIPADFQSNIKQWQQGFISREEVAGASTNSGAIDLNYRIPKLSNKKGLQSNKLNELASNISPPAKEKKKETSSVTQPHKNKKGCQSSQQGGTRKSESSRKK